MSTANRMGIVDPDSMTQTYEITQAKIVDSGQYLTAMYGNYCSGYNTDEHMNAETPTGFMPLIWEGQHPVVAGETLIGGSTGDPVFVSSTTKELEACLRFINMMYDEDAMLVMQGGPQGELWDIVDRQIRSDGRGRRIPGDRVSYLRNRREQLRLVLSLGLDVGNPAFQVQCGIPHH